MRTIEGGGTRMCVVCNQGKPWRGALDLQRMIGQRRVRMFVCLDCLRAAVSRADREWPIHAAASAVVTAK